MANQIQNKLNAFEVQPPEAVWEKIAEKLDEATPPFVQRLQQYQVIPDNENCNKINAVLDNDPKVEKGFFKKHHKWFVYSGAAAAIVLIAVFITLLAPSKSISKETASTTNVKPSSLTDQATKENTKEDNIAATIKKEKQAPDNTIEKTNSAIAKVEDSRYVTVTKDDGNKVRLSKKVLAVYTCATNTINERCKEQIHTLQDKVAAFASPSIDFAGFVEMVKNLNEDQ
ncbi:MAG: hypothetical protein C4329_13640 [Chitinophagaceae bacterium]